MQKPISARAHGLLDYVVVVVFALAPTVLGLTGLAALLAYALAGVHLVMTLLTAFPLGVLRVIPFRVHGLVEVVVGPALVVLALALFSGAAWGFYLFMGSVILVVWALTDYRSPIA
jgi:hypothetical protein